jgi:enoyl-CoA hydratase/carnithine racemase
VGSQFIDVDYSDDHMCVQLNRPPVNAFTVLMFEQLTHIISRISGDPRPILLSGAASFFSAGFDTKDPESDPAAADRAARTCVATLQGHPGPIVATVQGAAVGVGLLLAMSSDVLVIAQNAKLLMPEVTLGIDADAGPLRRFIPEASIRRMCLLGAPMTAEDLSLKAAGAIVCDSSETQKRAVEVIHHLARLDAGAIRRIKAGLDATEG